MFRITTVVPRPTSNDPREAGRELAEELLKADNVDWDGLSIDISPYPGNLFISPFFYAFWQRLWEDRPNLDPHDIEWITLYRFQKRNIRSFANNFEPYDPTTEPGDLLQELQKSVKICCALCGSETHVGLQCPTKTEEFIGYSCRWCGGGHLGINCPKHSHLPGRKANEIPVGFTGYSCRWCGGSHLGIDCYAKYDRLKDALQRLSSIDFSDKLTMVPVWRLDKVLKATEEVQLLTTELHRHGEDGFKQVEKHLDDLFADGLVKGKEFAYTDDVLGILCALDLSDDDWLEQVAVPFIKSSAAEVAKIRQFATLLKRRMDAGEDADFSPLCRFQTNSPSS